MQERTERTERVDSDKNQKTTSKAAEAKAYFAQFVKGEIINHKRYGAARVLKHLVDQRNRHGVLLKLLDESKKFLFYYDRRGVLPRCFEPNMYQVEKLERGVEA